MQGAFDPDGSKPISYSEADVVCRDRIQAAASTLAGVGDALYFRAVAEDDDMLAMLADVVHAEVENLRQAYES